MKRAVPAESKDEMNAELQGTQVYWVTEVGRGTPTWVKRLHRYVETERINHKVYLDREEAEHEAALLAYNDWTTTIVVGEFK